MNSDRLFFSNVILVIIFIIIIKLLKLLVLYYRTRARTTLQYTSRSHGICVLGGLIGETNYVCDGRDPIRRFETKNVLPDSDNVTTTGASSAERERYMGKQRFFFFFLNSEPIYDATGMYENNVCFPILNVFPPVKPLLFYLGQY